MAISLRLSLFFAGLIHSTNVLGYANESGFGGPGQTNRDASLIPVFIRANENPLNETTISFPGFNFSADAASNDNATAIDSSTNTPVNWTMRAGLGLLNVANGITGYPLSEANITTNMINVAFSFDFPGDSLPNPNDTDWNLCAFDMGTTWSVDVLQRAIDDPGDCSNVLGASCLQAVHTEMQKGLTSRTGSGCPSAVIFSNIDECSSFGDTSGSVLSAQIGHFSSSYAGTNSTNNTEIGLKADQIWGFQSSTTFNGSQAQAYYNDYASRLYMYIVTFKPSAEFSMNNPGTVNGGAVRTLCTVLNKDQAEEVNAAPSLSAMRTTGTLAVVWAILFALGML